MSTNLLSVFGREPRGRVLFVGYSVVKLKESELLGLMTIRRRLDVCCLVLDVVSTEIVWGDVWRLDEDDEDECLRCWLVYWCLVDGECERLRCGEGEDCRVCDEEEGFRCEVVSLRGLRGLRVCAGGREEDEKDVDECLEVSAWGVDGFEMVVLCDEDVGRLAGGWGACVPGVLGVQRFA